jgi:hypothetical protein
MLCAEIGVVNSPPVATAASPLEAPVLFWLPEETDEIGDVS